MGSGGAEMKKQGYWVGWLTKFVGYGHSVKSMKDIELEMASGGSGCRKKQIILHMRPDKFAGVNIYHHILSKLK